MLLMIMHLNPATNRACIHTIASGDESVLQIVRLRTAVTIVCDNEVPPVNRQHQLVSSHTSQSSSSSPGGPDGVGGAGSFANDRAATACYTSVRLTPRSAAQLTHHLLLLKLEICVVVIFFY